jgi:hypothetical protein
LGTARTLVAPGKAAVPGIPGIPGLGAPATGGGLPGIPGLPGVGAPAAKPKAAGLPGVPGLPGVGAPAAGKPKAAGLPGLPGLPGIAPEEPARPKVDKHDPFGAAAAPVGPVEGAVDVEKLVREAELKDLPTEGSGRSSVVLLVILGVAGLLVGLAAGYLVAINSSRDMIVKASKDHARTIQDGLQNLHVPAQKVFSDKVAELTSNITQAMSTRNPAVIMGVLQTDMEALSKLLGDAQYTFDKDEMVGAKLLVGHFSAFDSESLTPVLLTISLWNRLKEQIIEHTRATTTAAARYAWTTALLSGANLDNHYKCQRYVEAHKADVNPSETVTRTMERCTRLVQRFSGESFGGLSGLMASAIAAYEADQAISEALVENPRETLQALGVATAKVVGADADPTIERLWPYVGATRYAIVFEKNYWGSVSDGNYAVQLGNAAMLYEIDGTVEVLGDLVTHQSLGIASTTPEPPPEGTPAPPAPAAGEEEAAEPPPSARNLVQIVIGGGASEAKEQIRYLFVPDPVGKGDVWNDLNGDDKFDDADVELFWESFRAKPELWAIAINPRPALDAAFAYDAVLIAQYQARLVEIGKTLDAIGEALREAIEKMGRIR